MLPLFIWRRQLSQLHLRFLIKVILKALQMNFLKSKGFVTVAIGKDYLLCANILAASIKKTQQFNNVTLITNCDNVDSKYFDKVIKIDDNEPWNVISNLINYSPYEETMYIESDMILTSDLKDWWQSFRLKDLAVTQQVMDHKNSLYTGNLYRKFFIENYLPNVYSGILYFKKNSVTETIFKFWHDYTINWSELKSNFKFNIYDKLPADEGLSLSLRNWLIQSFHPCHLRHLQLIPNHQNQHPLKF